MCKLLTSFRTLFVLLTISAGLYLTFPDIYVLGGGILSLIWSLYNTKSYWSSNVTSGGISSLSITDLQRNDDWIVLFWLQDTSVLFNNVLCIQTFDLGHQEHPLAFAHVTQFLYCSQ